MTFCVYQHIRPDTNTVFYVGIGNIKRPFHLKSRNKLWNRIVKKNNGSFKVEILFENLTSAEAKRIEIDLIKKYGRKDLGTGLLVNLTDGGEGLLNLSENARQQRCLNIRKSLANMSVEKKESKRLKNQENAKIRKYSKGKIIAYKYPSMEFVGEYFNANEAKRDLNVNNISYCLNKRFKSIKGYCFNRI